ncbi:MAG: hypothetical protein Kow0068_10560 [Marinilabiliales bacterium]
MRKIVLTLALFALVLGLSAQTAVQLDKVDLPYKHTNTKVADTIWTYMDRATNYYIYGVMGGGYIFGNNGYYTETAMNYDGIANASVTEVLLWVGAKYVISGADLTVNVYSATNDTTPGSLIGSGTISMNAIDTTMATGGFNFIPLSTPAATGGNPFFVGINLTSNDTIGVVCSDPSSGDGAGEKRAVLSYSGMWFSIDYMFGGFDADGMYIPVVDIATDANCMEQNGLQVMRAYPNPTNDITNIHFALNEASNVKVKVFDITGKTIFQTESFETAGEHIIPVDFSSYSAGKYYYTITTDKARITTTIAVVK